MSIKNYKWQMAEHKDTRISGYQRVVDQIIRIPDYKT